MTEKRESIAAKLEDQDLRAVAVDLLNGAGTVIDNLTPVQNHPSSDVQAMSTVAVAGALRSIGVSLVRIGDLLEAEPEPVAGRGRWQARQRQRGR
jgi:hypothetical protein